MEEQESSLTFNSAASHQVLDMIDHPKSQPLLLSFSNISYKVKIRRKTMFGSPTERLLLDDISGEAREGEILAVLGASGSGKSTLLDALANCIAKESLKGTVKLNGEALESRLSAYVMQDDLLYPMLTVEETLMFAAQFRLPRTLSHSKKKLRVQALIDQLGLRSAAKTVIGNAGHRGVSGGERRRVSIGIDIIHSPLVLFLDEPTSGLDSTSAFMVVNVLRRIAQSGSIVIMSVHQPSYRIIGLLDRLIFLSCGQAVYSGLPASLPDFFAKFGNPVPEDANRAEFGLDLIRELEQSPGGTKGLVEFNKSWQSMMMMKSQNDSVVICKSEPVSTKVIGIGPHFANSFWVEVAVLSRRSMLNSWRMPEIFGVRLGVLLVAGIILGTLFWRLDNSPRGVQERLGVIAFAMSTTFFICADALPAFVEDRFIFLRETSYNAYRRWAYVLAHSLVSIPFLIVLSLVFAGSTYWAVGLAGGFMFYLSVILASFWAGSSFVTFLSGVIPHVMMGFTVAVALLSYFLLFSGFFITRDRIPEYWIWFHYISLVKYPYEAVMQNEFQSSSKCFVRGVQLFDNSPLAMVAEPLKLNMLDQMSNTLGMSLNGSTCLTTGADVLRQQGITDLSKWSCLWITIAFGFFYRILFYFTLLLGGRNKRR